MMNNSFSEEDVGAKGNGGGNANNNVNLNNGQINEDHANSNGDENMLEEHAILTTEFDELPEYKRDRV